MILDDHSVKSSSRKRDTAPSQEHFALMNNWQYVNIFARPINALQLFHFPAIAVAHTPTVCVYLFSPSVPSLGSIEERRMRSISYVGPLIIIFRQIKHAFCYDLCVME